eukprot:4060551-Amphidinium_carterae.1
MWNDRDSDRCCLMSTQVFAMVNRPEKMYFVGFLFGLSFDTATQVGLLGMAAMTGAHEPVPVWIENGTQHGQSGST